METTTERPQNGLHVVNERTLAAIHHQQAESQPQPAQKPKTGRPTDYRDHYPNLLNEYFDTRLAAITGQPVEYQPEGQGAGSQKAVVQRMYFEFPTIAGFAASIGTHEQRIYEWAKRHEALAEARARVQSLTKHALSSGMLEGRFNVQAGMFVAKNLTDMRDKVEIEQTTRVEDSDDTIRVKQALASASPEQLQSFAALIEAMQANAPLVASEQG